MTEDTVRPHSCGDCIHCKVTFYDPIPAGILNGCALVEYRSCSIGKEHPADGDCRYWSSTVSKTETVGVIG